MDEAGPSTQNGTPSQTQRELDFKANMVTDHLQRIVQPDEILLKNTSAFKDDLRAAAEHISELTDRFPGNTAKVQQLRDILKSVVALEAGVESHRDAVRGLATNYTPGVDPTKWDTLLKTRTAEHLQNRTVDPESSADLRRFDQDTGTAGVGEDDDVVETGVTAAACPLSQKPVLLLEDPVADEMGYIYSYAALMQFMNGRETVKCPAAGTSHWLTRHNIDQARGKRMVAKLRRRDLIRQGTQQQANPNEVVLD